LGCRSRLEKSLGKFSKQPKNKREPIKGSKKNHRLQVGD